MSLPFYIRLLSKRYHVENSHTIAPVTLLHIGNILRYDINAIFNYIFFFFFLSASRLSGGTNAVMHLSNVLFTAPYFPIWYA
jgi:hypothetical protein